LLNKRDCGSDLRVRFRRAVLAARTLPAPTPSARPRVRGCSRADSWQSNVSSRHEGADLALLALLRSIVPTSSPPNPDSPRRSRPTRVLRRRRPAVCFLLHQQRARPWSCPAGRTPARPSRSSPGQECAGVFASCGSAATPVCGTRFQQATGVTLTKSCRCNDSSGDDFMSHLGQAGIALLFAGSIESLSHRQGRAFRVVSKGELVWPPPPPMRQVPAHLRC
jgi:hypothetical protein